MRSEWREVTLGAAADLLTGFPFQSRCYTDSAEDVRLLRGDNVVQGQLRWDDVRRWPQADRGEYERYALRPDDVVLAMDRPWIEAGLKFARLTEHDLPSLLVQRVARLRATTAAHQRFLHYVIAHPDFTEYVLGVQTGTSVPHLSPAQIRGYRFALPPLAEQRAIAGVLGALDDKIAANRRLSGTLEALARRLFRSWFVDFDPVVARAAGRRPVGVPASAAGLFPAAFADSPLGPIPQGWRVGTVGELLHQCRDGVNPSRFPNEVFALYSIPAYDSDRRPELLAGHEIKSNKHLVPPGAVLLSKLNPHTPRVWIPDPATGDRAICSTEYIVASPRGGASASYLYGLFTAADFADEFTSMVTGTSNSHQRVRPGDLGQMATVVPPPALMASYADAASPLLARAGRCRLQSRTLAALRDALLPRLLSGELRVRGTKN